jgi:hypothetical protein
MNSLTRSHFCRARARVIRCHGDGTTLESKIKSLRIDKYRHRVEARELS